MDRAAWRAEAAEWVLTSLAEAGIRPTGAIEQPRVRPWSIQLTVPTDQGRFWFKENCPALAFEGAMIAEIASIPITLTINCEVLAALPTDHPSYRNVLRDAEDRLAEIGIPSTLQHNDLHQNNTFGPWVWTLALL